MLILNHMTASTTACNVKVFAHSARPTENQHPALKFYTALKVQYFFSLFWHGSKDGNVGLTAGQSTTLVQTEISQQPLDGLPWNFLQRFIVLRGLILLFWWIPKLFLKHHPQVKVFTAICEIPQMDWHKTIFRLALPWGWHLWFWMKSFNTYWITVIFVTFIHTLVYEQIPAILMIFPSA